jgi:hypothetical protein
MLFADIVDGAVVGGLTMVDGTIVYAGDWLVAQAIFNSATRQR